MPILAIVAPKGGVGKTTLAATLAIAALQAGVDTAALDLDAQGSLARWATKRAAAALEPPLRVVTAAPRGWRGALPAATLVVVDTPPGLEGDAALDGLEALATAAALTLIPTPPSEMALEAVGELGAVLGATFVLNMVDQRSPLLADVRAHLRRLANLCPVEIPRQVDIERETGSGGTVLDRPRLGGAQEMTALWDYVADRLGLA